jgi:hypothetical protein
LVLVARALVFAGFMIGALVSQNDFGIMLFGLFLVLSVLSPVLNRRQLARARRRHPMKGTVGTFSMDQGGLNVVGAHSNAQFQWPAMVCKVSHPDGVFLKFQTRSIVWRLDRSLVRGSPSDVRQLLAVHVKDCPPKKASTVGAQP